jgi:hypothetical protein
MVLLKVEAVVIGESYGGQRVIVLVAISQTQTRDRLRCLATSVGLGRISCSSISFSSVEIGNVNTSCWTIWCMITNSLQL